MHDVGDYKIGGEWRVLEPGMVLTVEPGIYIAPDNRAVAKKWRGIGRAGHGQAYDTKDESAARRKVGNKIQIVKEIDHCVCVEICSWLVG